MIRCLCEINNRLHLFQEVQKSAHVWTIIIDQWDSARQKRKYKGHRCHTNMILMYMQVAHFLGTNKTCLFHAPHIITEVEFIRHIFISITHFAIFNTVWIVCQHHFMSIVPKVKDSLSSKRNASLFGLIFCLVFPQNTQNFSENEIQCFSKQTLFKQNVNLDIYNSVL